MDPKGDRLSEEIKPDSTFQPTEFFHGLVNRDGIVDIKKNCDELETDCAKLSIQRDEVILKQYDAYCQANQVSQNFLANFSYLESSLVFLQQQLELAINSPIPEQLDITPSKAKFNTLSTCANEIAHLEFLKRLPKSIIQMIEKKNYCKAVEEYLRAESIALALLDKKKASESQQVRQELVNIKDEITSDLKSTPPKEFVELKDQVLQTGELLRKTLRANFTKDDASPMELINWLKCLQSLKEPHSELCHLFLTQYGHQLDISLKRLEAKNPNDEIINQHKDWLPYNPEHGFEAFVKNGCSTFINNVQQMIGFYANTFISDFRNPHSAGEESMVSSAVAHLGQFCEDILKRLLCCVEEKAIVEAERHNLEKLARCYGEFYSQIMVVAKLLPKTDLERPTVDQIVRVAEHCCVVQLEEVKSHIDVQIEAVKLQLDVLAFKVADEKSKPGIKDEIHALLKGLVYALEGKWRTSLEPLTVFLMPELIYTEKKKTGFCAAFKNLVLQHMIYGYLDYFWTAVEGLCDGRKNADFHPLVLLIFFRVCREYEKCLVPYIFTTVVDKFQNPFSRPPENDPDFGDRQSRETLHVVTHMDVNVCDKMMAVGRKLVDRFTFVQGQLLTKMIRSGLGTKRSLVPLGPKRDGAMAVSPEIRHVVTDLNAMDFYVDLLIVPDELDPIVRQTPNVRAYYHFGILPQASAAVLQLPSGSPTPSTTNALTATDSSEKQLVRSLNRLFVDCPEYYSSVHPRRDAIMSAVICIAAKAYAEMVRTRTFSGDGLKQVQANAYYFAIRAAKMMTDEHLLYTLMDEVVAGAVSRTAGSEKELFSQEKLDEFLGPH